MVKRVKIVHASGRGAAERWRSQYHSNNTWRRTAYGDSEDIYNRLCDLGPNPDAKAVAEVIGNQSWSYLTCVGCGEYITRGASFGADYAEQDILLCGPCLRDGLSAIDAPAEAAS